MRDSTAEGISSRLEESVYTKYHVGIKYGAGLAKIGFMTIVRIQIDFLASGVGRYFQPRLRTQTEALFSVECLVQGGYFDG